MRSVSIRIGWWFIMGALSEEQAFPYGNAHTVLIVAGGGAPTALPAGVDVAHTWVIGVDSGIDHALGLGLPVHQAVGDFDSVSSKGLAAVRASGAVVERYPTAKDATDLELALDAALSREPDQAIVLGGHGGRLDHLLANISLLASPRFASMPITAFMGDAIVTVIRRATVLHGHVGDVVSLLPMHGPARGVHTTGLRYPLDGDDLPAGTSRGISNEFAAPAAQVTLHSGVLVAIWTGST